MKIVVLLDDANMATQCQKQKIVFYFDESILRFCGWVDVGLSELGQQEAERAARDIVNSGIKITKIYTSLLRRANLTVDKILQHVTVDSDKVIRDWRLNERHYGALTGLNKGTSTSYYN